MRAGRGWIVLSRPGAEGCAPWAHFALAVVKRFLSWAVLRRSDLDCSWVGRRVEARVVEVTFMIDLVVVEMFEGWMVMEWDCIRCLGSMIGVSVRSLYRKSEDMCWGGLSD